MKRKEQIQDAAADYRDGVCCGFYDPVADARQDSFICGANWADETMVNKACKWLKENMYVEHIFEYDEDEEPKQYVCASASDSVDNFVNNFCKAMEK